MLFPARYRLPIVWFFLLQIFQFSAFGPAAYGQPYVRSGQIGMRFDHLPVDQGLSNFTPTAVAQDKLGFLWIGTEDGLNRYDGLTFKIYRPKMNDTSSLDAGMIYGLVCDRDGDVWVSAQSDGLFRYDRQRDAFRRLRLPALTSNLQLISAVRIQSRDGLLWIASNDGAYTLDKRTWQIQRAVHRSSHPSLTSNAIYSIVEDRGGMIWLGTDSGINRFDPRTNAVVPFPLDLVGPGTRSYGAALDLQCDSMGTVWAATSGGLLRYNPSNNAFDPAPFTIASGKPMSRMQTQSLYVDTRGILWVGTMDDGLIELDPARNTLRQHLHNDRDPYSLYNDRVTRMVEDRSGVLWVGSYRAGLNRFVRRLGCFSNMRLQKSVYAILEDSDGEVWVGTTDGLLRWKTLDGRPILYANSPLAQFKLHQSDVYALAEDSLGYIWIGLGNCITRLSKKDNRTRIYQTVFDQGGSTPISGYVKSLCIDRDGDLWAGVDQHNLLLYDRKKDLFRQFNAGKGGAAAGNIPSVWAICPDANGSVWFATFGHGLYRYDKHTSTLTRWTATPDDSTSLPHEALYFVRGSSRGGFWVGTFGRGIARFDPHTSRFRRFTVDDGLPDNFVKGMLEDARGNLWFSTDKGISRFDPASGTFKNYREKDGLHTNVFLSGACFKGRGGQFYFGGENGVTTFHPDSLKENLFAPSVIITSFKVLERAIPSLSGFIADSTLTMNLGYRENFFSFEFTSTDFTAPDRNEFSFKLEGLDRDWVQTGTRHYASYMHVPPGDYILRVRGTNSDGLWSPNIASLHVVVAPPPWERWWFRTLAALIFVGIALALYNYRVHRLLEIERLRIRIASDLHDDIGASLTRISLQSELIQENIEPAEQQSYLTSIATLSRDLVTSMSDIVWSIDSRNDSTGDLLDRMRSYGSAHLSAREVDFTLTHSGLETKKKLPVDVRENLYLIYKEAINNVVKHANAHSVTVDLRNEPAKFVMTIVDDGEGWDGRDRPGGHGVKNIRMRADRLGGTAEFVRDGGTRVVLTMRRI